MSLDDVIGVDFFAALSLSLSLSYLSVSRKFGISALSHRSRPARFVSVSANLNWRQVSSSGTMQPTSAARCDWSSRCAMDVSFSTPANESTSGKASGSCPAVVSTTCCVQCEARRSRERLRQLATPQGAQVLQRLSFRYLASGDSARALEELDSSLYELVKQRLSLARCGVAKQPPPCWEQDDVPLPFTAACVKKSPSGAYQPSRGYRSAPLLWRTLDPLPKRIFGCRAATVIQSMHLPPLVPLSAPKPPDNQAVSLGQ
ncbi:unnamed protein product [Durusdinium trenchii]|uniref:Uncharacterized protein n=1 Tax=Durusdinium trenchii TaxID=1381693 RepID=A0ABP0JRM2_9DINO